MTGRLVLVAALGLTTAAGAGEGAPPRRERIALERLRAEGVSEALAAAVEERLCAALLERSGADVVCPADVAAALDLARQAAILGECASDECLRRVDRAREADRRVTGELELGAKGGLVLRLRTAGPGGAAGPSAEERLPEDLDALLARIPDVVAKLFP